MDQKNLLTKFLKKNKIAVRNIKAYTWCVQALLLIYGGVFIYSLATPGDTILSLISFIINFVIILRIGVECSYCRNRLNPPENYSKAKVKLKAVLFLEMFYFSLYVLASGVVSRGFYGPPFSVAVSLLAFSSPIFLMALVGFCVIKNFKILSMPFHVYQGKYGSQQQGEGKEVAENPPLEAAYVKAPEPFRQSNYGLAKNEGVVVDPS